MGRGLVPRPVVWSQSHLGRGNVIMDRCQQEGCRGHLGKFADCLSEMLYVLSVRGFATDATGDVAFQGHVSLFVVRQQETHDLDGVKVTVPPGGYLLTEVSSGAVTLYTSGSVEGTRAAFAAEDKAYGQWLEETQPA